MRRDPKNDTFYKKRICRHCGKPIADQESAARIYCHKIILEDGSVQDCKDDYHAPRRKISDAPFKRIFDYHKEAHKRIGSLLTAKGSNVTTEQLNQFGIKLNRPIEFIIDKNHNITCFFVEFAITDLTNNQYKILKHGRVF